MFGFMPSVVFAQQLPQLSFALSGLEGQANKTLARIGRLGTFLSGPWGLAVGLGAGVLAGLVTSLLSTDDAASKAEKSTYDFTKAVDFSTLSIRQMSDAVAQLNKETERLIATQARAADMNLANSKAAVAEAEKRMAAISKKIGALGPERTGAELLLYGADVSTEYKRAELMRDYSAAAKARDAALASVTNAQLALANRAVTELTDTSAKLRSEYDRALADLQARRQRSAAAERPGGQQPADYITQAEYDRRALALKAGYDRDLKTYRDSQRASSPSSSRDARVGDMTALLQQLFPGVRITSTTGGRHTKGSDHYAGRAVDFVVPGMMNAAGTAEIRRMLDEAGVEIRRNARGTEQFFGPGKGAKTPNDHRDRRAKGCCHRARPDPSRHHQECGESQCGKATLSQ